MDDLDFEGLNNFLTYDGHAFKDFDYKQFERFYSWCEKPMKEWTDFEVIDFLKSESEFYNMDIDVKVFNKFSGLNGHRLEKLSQEECQELTSDKRLGNLIFELKTNHLQHNIKVKDKNFRRPGRPPKNIGNKSCVKRSQKLWEFIIGLLKNKYTCPTLIRWENFTEGSFRFVQGEKVARLWGKRNNNENMNYEKFSRAMRYYYKSQILLPVRGKRLVYKFGPSAKGWKSLNCVL